MPNARFCFSLKSTWTEMLHWPVSGSSSDGGRFLGAGATKVPCLAPAQQQHRAHVRLFQHMQFRRALASAINKGKNTTITFGTLNIFLLHSVSLYTTLSLRRLDHLLQSWATGRGEEGSVIEGSYHPGITGTYAFLPLGGTVYI